MEAALHGLAQWPGARWLQGSGTAYLFVNAAHILGIGLLLGSVLPLDWHLLRAGRRPLMAGLAATLSRTAAGGLALALATGLWLFSVRPTDYVSNTAFVCKLALLVLAAFNIAWQHARPGWRAVLAGAAPDAGVRWRAGLSLLLWLAILLAGRWIGFL